MNPSLKDTLTAWAFQRSRSFYLPKIPRAKYDEGHNPLDVYFCRRKLSYSCVMCNKAYHINTRWQFYLYDGLYIYDYGIIGYSAIFSVKCVASPGQCLIGDMGYDSMETSVETWRP